ncbi:hypothetical protein LAZ40_11810 [Cereibacter sphaeroides]|uniref:hypothetical protein n=1 Tax=Cereibacter sphaeroides TaxID=1063 RepID=UPI001F3E8B60|nr:hypothetical protein [Cereibacter sphaeroides]MCE6959705.1 hypothetical protein [Cereibacter sphaeroides]MCE6974434.1 hypothetical protein [Cereibacter sphaeroides]
MFNLIVAVFSVVLIAVLALAAIYYSGDAVSVRTIDAEYSRLANSATQVKGAFELFHTREGNYPVAADTAGYFSELTSNGYMSTPLQGPWTIDGTQITHPIDGEEICSRMNFVAGFKIETVENGCPPCDEATYAQWPACHNV